MRSVRGTEVWPAGTSTWVGSSGGGSWWSPLRNPDGSSTSTCTVSARVVSPLRNTLKLAVSPSVRLRPAGTRVTPAWLAGKAEEVFMTPMEARSGSPTW